MSFPHESTNTFLFSIGSPNTHHNQPCTSAITTALAILEFHKVFLKSEVSDGKQAHNCQKSILTSDLITHFKLFMISYRAIYKLTFLLFLLITGASKWAT